MTTEKEPKPSRKGFLSLAILRDILIVLLVAIVGWRILNAELKVDLSAFSFTDLLALIMSLFSIWLSVAFYFKATDASGQFYDNTYRFTKEMSEILGRIEAGFGERLRHIDEGYAGIRERFDRLPSYGKVTKDEVQKEEEEVRKKEKEQHDLLEELTQRAKLAEHEKQSFLQALSQTTDELEQARVELRRLKANSRRSNSDLSESRGVIRYIAQRIREATPPGADAKSPQLSIQGIFESIANELPRGAIQDLERYDLLDESGNLTRDAMMRIRTEMRRI